MPMIPPPGRAGRLWLQARLGVARRAADLLDRKERLLRSDVRRLSELASSSSEAWDAACRRAETWAARTALVGGRDDLFRPGPPAAAEVIWSNSMGLSYPTEATCRQAPPVPVVSANPALGFAVAANRRAVDAAVHCAAASYALGQVTAELSATRRRRRAIAERWIPDLESALARLESRLDELEREEHVRARWAQRRAPRSRP